MLEFLQAREDKEFQFDEEAIISVCQENDNNQSLAIKILSVFGGVLACLFFLGFFFIGGLYDSDFGMLILGMLCIAGAIWINKNYDKIIIDTISVSLFLIGFTLLAFGFDKIKISENIICIVFILIAFLSLKITQNYIISFISVLIVNGSILALIIMNNAYELLHIYVSVFVLIITYFFQKEAKIITRSEILSKLYNPVRVGFIFSFLAGLILVVIEKTSSYVWLSSIIIISAIIYFMFNLFEILNITSKRNKMVFCILCTLLLLPTIFSPGISGCILIIFLSFWVNYKTGLVIGIVAFIYFISQYYYDLHFTLLIKSMLLFFSGIFFISLYLFIHKKIASK